MKRVIIIFITLICLQGVLSGQDHYLKEKYKSKIENYNRKKNNGTTLSTLGTVSIGGGVVLLVSGAQGAPYNSTANDTKILGGSILLGVGVDLFIGGIILSSVGKRKSKEYNQKLRDISFGINCKPENRGVSLVYRF